MKAGVFCSNQRWGVLFIALLAICVSHTAFSQDRWSVEFRPGVNVATGKLGNENLKTGAGFEGTVAYRLMPHLGVYGGWSWNRFAGTSSDFEETGYTYGLQFIHPLGNSKLSLLARAGAVSNHIEVENESGEIIADSGHGLGWQVEGGIVIPLTEKWRLLPGVRYRSISRHIQLGSVTTGVDLNYLSFGVGISRLF